MPFPKRQGGWGADQTSNPPNPFANPTSKPINPFAPSQTTPHNPFSKTQLNGEAAAFNPFSAQPTNPFSNTTSTAKPTAKINPFSDSSATKANPFSESTSTTKINPFAPQQPQKPAPKLNPFASQSSPFTSGSQARPASTTNGVRKVPEDVMPARPSQNQRTSDSAFQNQINGKRKNENDFQPRSKFSRKSPDSQAASGRHTQGTNKDTTFVSEKPGGSRREDPDVFAKKIWDQLRKDNIRPPRWPENPGSLASRQAIERLRESHKVYREKARQSLIRAGLTHDPDKKRRLDQALVFKGICEDMCPEWEQITRIVEHDIKGPEKEMDDKGELVAVPQLMVKRLARSAAGQESPLPMDVRSVETLRKTLVYLTDLIESDELLPQRHSFLWDRTRAIRIDFAFQKYAMTGPEIIQQVDCLETIARFHVISLHLLSRNGFTPVDFSEQQEVEQLSKTLISLMEVYDDCVQRGIKCDNEAEFRGYFIVFNAFNPSLTERIEDWDRRFGDAQGIKSAIFITECLKSVQRPQGPLYPEANTQMTVDFASAFFEFIKSPIVSYTLACFAEIHFNTIRKAVVKLVKKSCSRPRFGPKDLTPAILKQYLYTDTEEEAVDFFTKHGFQMDDDGKYLVLSPSPEYIDTRMPHPFSGDIVERKRRGLPFTVIVHSTVAESTSTSSWPMPDHTYREDNEDNENDQLFVADSQSVSSASNDQEEGSEPQDSESEGSAASPRPLPAMLGNHVVTRQDPAAPAVQSRSPTPSETGSLSPPTFAGQPFIPTSTSLGEVVNSAFAQNNASGAQPASFASSSTAAPLSGSVPGTSPLGASTSTSASWAQNLTTGPTNAPGPKTVRFEDEISANQAPAPTSKAATTPNIFGSLNASDGSKDAATSSALPEASPSPGLPNKEEPKLQLSSLMSTALSPISNPVQPTFTSSPASPKFTTQPAAPQAEKPSAMSQQTTPLESSIKETAAFSTLNPPSNTPPQKTTQRDLMGDFAKWFVCGDKGMMESQLEEIAIVHILEETWNNFQTYEDERIQKEQDESLLAEAREFREKSLQVKFFYRWKDGFRKRRRLMRMKKEMEKGRQWRLPENVAKRERAEKEKQKEKQEKIIKGATDSMLTRSRNVKEAAKLRHSAGPILESKNQSPEDRLSESRLETASLQSRIESIEEQLLASGVFDGMQDERAAARWAAMACDPENEKQRQLELKVRLRAENRDRAKRGLSHLKALPEPKVFREGSKTAMLRAKCRLAERDASLYKSTGSFRSSPFSSSYRSSLGHNSNRVSKSQSRVTDPYWRLKAKGLVRMPNGEYLPESIALPILQGDQRVSGLGTYGIKPMESATPTHSPPPLPNDFFSPPIQTDGLARSKDTPSTGEHQKRKRRADEEDLASIDFGTPPSMKRARSDERASPSVTNAEAHLADIESLMKQVSGFRKSIKKA